MAEVFKVFEQDRVLQQRTWTRSLNFQFLWVGEGEREVLKALSQDGVQQRIWGKSLIFLLVVVFTVFSQDRVLPHRADFFKDFKGFFALFPSPKNAKVTRQSSPRVPASVSSSELSARQMAPAGESDELADERWRRGLRRRDGKGELRRRWRCRPD